MAQQQARRVGSWVVTITATGKVWEVTDKGVIDCIDSGRFRGATYETISDYLARINRAIKNDPALQERVAPR